MGNQTSKKNVRKSIKKDQINNMCSKLKNHLDTSIKKKQVEIDQQCKELIGMIKSPQRNKEAELHKMIIIAQEKNHVKGLEILQRYQETIKSRSQAICSGFVNQMEITSLVPMIEALGFSTNHANLQNISEFTTFMKKYFGTKDYMKQIWESNSIDPEFKKCFEKLPQNQYSFDVNNLALSLCQQGQSLEEINNIGHPFSQTPQQFYSNIGQSPYLSPQQSHLTTQYNPQQSPQQFPSNQQFNQHYLNQEYQSNQYQTNSRLSNQSYQSKQDTYSNHQNIPINFQSNPYSQNSTSNVSQQSSQRDIQQYQNNQNFQINQNNEQSYSKQNSQYSQQSQQTRSNQGSQIEQFQQPQSQQFSQNQQQIQLDQNGVPILFPFNYSISIQPQQNTQFGENFMKPYEEVYNSNRIGNKDDYQYPTQSEFQKQQEGSNNQNPGYAYLYNSKHQNSQSNNQYFIRNNKNHPSYIAIANKFQPSNQFNNGQLPEDFKYHNMIESKDIQFANQIYQELNYIHPNGSDVKTIKEKIENQEWNVDVAKPQIKVQQNSNISSQQNSKLTSDISKNQEINSEDQQKRSSIKYPPLNTNSNLSHHEQQLSDIQNNIQIQNQILSQKQIEVEIDSKLHQIQQELQIQNDSQNKNILTSSVNNDNLQNQYGQNSEVIYIQESLVIPFQTSNNSTSQQNNNDNTNSISNNNNSNNNNKNNKNENNNIQKDQYEIKSSFTTQGESINTNQILKDMNLENNHKNIQQMLNDQLKQGKNDIDCSDAYITSTIIKEINKNRNTVNFNQNDYHYDSNISSTFRQ